ncbi:MAG: 4Fe-4S dicluster domain-containing protein [Tessaracoccus sp.]
MGAPTEPHLSSSQIATEAPAPQALQLNAVGCIACGACVEVCPNDALELTTDDTRSLLHRPQNCEGSGACIQSCPAGALSGNGVWSTLFDADSPPETLATVPTVRCDRCGRQCPEQEGTPCSSCRYLTTRTFGEAISVAELQEMLRRS